MSEEPMQRPRLVYLTTHAASAQFLMTGQLAYMRERGFDVYLISSPDRALGTVAAREGVTTIPISLEREIHPWRDLGALIRIYRVLRRLQPEIVNAGTPKAGLLGMLAAWLARVPVRLYTLRGLRLETTRGLKQFVLGFAERIASCCAHQVLCVSRSLRQTYVERGLTAQHKTFVLGAGSSNGINATRFIQAAERRTATAELRAQLKIPADAPVIGFIGRLTRDKGILELFNAFDSLLPQFPTLRLVLAGDFEAGDPLPEHYLRQLREHPQVVLTGFVPDTAPYFPLFDLLAFPSYREGFPNVPLEAAAAGIPVVGFEATGTVDAVQEGVTGTLVPLHDTLGLSLAIKAYLTNPQLRQAHGAAGRARVLADFRQETIWEALFQRYVRMLRDRGCREPLGITPAEARATSARAA
jgi:glycosyltransferase involved in cell wall biosynthesis